MSRTTQYIGLTDRAREFTKTCIPVEDPRNVATGMFEEDVFLGSWQWVDSVKKGPVRVKEVVQLEPWSSGPMIFTCLEFQFKDGGDHLIPCKAFEWTANPTVTNEVDQKNGEYWV